MNCLGKILNQRLDDDDDDDDLRKNKSHFIGSVNKMFANFGNVQSIVVKHFWNDAVVVFMVVLYVN